MEQLQKCLTTVQFKTKKIQDVIICQSSTGDSLDIVSLRTSFQYKKQEFRN